MKGRGFCTSLQIAKECKKQHSHVLRDIEKEISDLERGLSKFGQTYAKEKLPKVTLEIVKTWFIKSTYKDSQGKKQPMYYTEKNGFAQVVLKYSGPRIAVFRAELIYRMEMLESYVKSLQAARAEYPMLTEAVKLSHPKPKPHHFRNEADMLNRIVLGMDAQECRKRFGLAKGISIRPYLPVDKITALEDLQRAAIGLHLAGMSYEDRKYILQNYHDHCIKRS